ncbi:MAG TPA: TIGR01777 family protein, partial [Xanthobacteraceae bacterium]|nr:TIGR01777 family protein [Xanthobacteraceae bacterium]
MTSTVLWVLIAIQIAMGGFDTIYHHEMTERLAWRPSQHRELQLHAARTMLYVGLFILLGWFEAHGLAAVAVLVILTAEIIITLLDFVEEDVSRKLPPSE